MVLAILLRRRGFLATLLLCIAWGITATMIIGALCYLALIPAAIAMAAEGGKAHGKAA